MNIILEKIITLEDGEHEYVFETSSQELHLDMKDFEGNNIFPETIYTTVNLKKTGQTYYIVIHAKTKSFFLCDRCLSEVHLPIEGSFSVVYSNLHHHVSLNSDDEYRMINIRQTNAIHLDKDVRDILILSIPQKILCRPDCRGLCVECGMNLNETTCEHAQAREIMIIE